MAIKREGTPEEDSRYLGVMDDHIARAVGDIDSCL